MMPRQYTRDRYAVCMNHREVPAAVWFQGPAHVVMRKAMRLDLDFAEALEPLLGEWDSEEDEEAYRGL